MDAEVVAGAAQHVPDAPTEYPSINDYAVIGDCRTAALISTQGSIDWLCLPHFSAPPVFAALLDRERGGCFFIRPGVPFTAVRRYAGATAVLETTFHTPTGTMRLTDTMPIPAKPRYAQRLHPEREVLRCIEVTSGEMDVTVHYAPRPNWAQRVPRLRPRGALGWACTSGGDLFLLHGDIPLQVSADGGTLTGTVRLSHGEKRHLALAYVRADIAVIAPLGAYALERVADTQAWWQAWAGLCRYRGPYAEAVARSALTLKLLTFQLSGAVVAAATTSLPEAIGGTRNWDYRYCWLRDASLTLCAFMDLGFASEGAAFLNWLLYTTRLSRPHMQVLYDVYGETALPERVLNHLEGYRGSRPVRIGNNAYRQLQLDVYGSVVMAAFDFVQRGGRLARDEARLLRGLGKVVCQLWRRPDHGIWEIRGTPEHYTYSKLMCWVALDRLLQLHARGQVWVPVDRFTRERDAIEHAIETQGYSAELGAYTAYFGAAIPDASLLLMARYGYRSAADDRMRATFACIERELTDDGLVYRYPPNIDHFASREGAFLITSFWAVDYLAQCGELTAARERFERLLEVANDVGLYAEQVDTETGALLGNFPQAFSHIGLIIAALSLDSASSKGADTC